MECWELPGPFGDPGLMKNHHLGLMYGNINPAVTGIIVALMNEAIRGNHFTVKLGNKERFDKEQIGIKELFMDYQPFYTINLLLDKELLPI